MPTFYLTKIKNLVLIIIFPILFSGCLGIVMMTGTAASAVLTAQEVEEDYNSNILDYIIDKSKSLYNYLEEKTND
jgi:hypothetical protein